MTNNPIEFLKSAIPFGKQCPMKMKGKLCGFSKKISSESEYLVHLSKHHSHTTEFEKIHAAILDRDRDRDMPFNVKDMVVHTTQDGDGDEDEDEDEDGDDSEDEQANVPPGYDLITRDQMDAVVAQMTEKIDALTDIVDSLILKDRATSTSPPVKGPLPHMATPRSRSTKMVNAPASGDVQLSTPVPDTTTNLKGGRISDNRVGKIILNYSILPTVVYENLGRFYYYSFEKKN
jgi:hypothetical protein